MSDTEIQSTANDINMPHLVVTLVLALIFEFALYHFDMLNMYSFLFSVFIFTVVFFVGQSDIKTMKQIEEQIEDGFKNLRNFSSTKILHEALETIYQSKKGIAIDENSKTLCCWKANKNSFQSNIIPYKSVISVEVFQDGVSLTKTNRTSQLGGALVGGVLFGGVGAIVGGLSGKTETKADKPKKVQLRVVINDTNNPLCDIDLMTAKGDGEKALNDARYWSGVFAAIIRQADEDDLSSHQQTEHKQAIKQEADKTDEQHQERVNITDRLNILAALKELAELKNSGVLTEYEFQEQKKKLLA